MMNIDKFLKRGLNIKPIKPKKIVRKTKIFGGRNDWDGDGVVNWKDCQPRNTMRQDFRKKSGVPIVDYAESYGYKKQTVMMTPDDYIRKAMMSHKYPHSQEQYERENIFQTNVERLKPLIQSNEKEMDAPWLETEYGIPVEQEGRHRAVAARQLGKKKIPVNIIEKKLSKQQERYQSPISLFHAGNEYPSQNLQINGRVYGFSNIEYARGWKQRHGFKHIYQFTTSKWVLDDKQYSRPYDGKNILSDNEYICYNVIKEELIE